MPELPEVETVCRGLAKELIGRRLQTVWLRRADLRRPFPPSFAQHLEGRRVDAVSRRAKYILITLDSEEIWLSHLGMSGGFRFLVPRSGNYGNDPHPHDHVIVCLDDGRNLVYNDPRRFGIMDIATERKTHPLLRHLGLEPLEPEFTGEALEARFAGRKSPIKTALLDQRLIAGVGNIYASEALYRAGISPRRPAGQIKGARAARLAEAIRTVLLKAIAQGGSSVKDFAHVDGEMGYFQTQWAVYERAGAACPDCDCAATGGAIRKIVQAGRSTYYCPKRQK